MKHLATYAGAIYRVMEVLSQDCISMTKKQLHYNDKGCDIAVVECFASEVMSKHSDTNVKIKPAYNLPKAQSHLNKKAKI